MSLLAKYKQLQEYDASDDIVYVKLVRNRSLFFVPFGIFVMGEHALCVSLFIHKTLLDFSQCNAVVFLDRLHLSLLYMFQLKLFVI